MRVIPVLDVQAGVVVRGVGGRRQDYRPVVSRLTTSTDPLDVAEAFRRHCGLIHLYLADLDALAGAVPAVSLYQDLQARGFRLWVDAGVRQVADAAALAAAAVEGIVVGLETVAGPAVLEALRHRFGPDRVIFSLDLKEGRPLGNVAAWAESTAEGIAGEAASLGVRQIIILDLARVGGGTGTGTDDLCRRLRTALPEVCLIAGGGVRHATDLRRLEGLGVQAALVASALHDGGLLLDTAASGRD